MKNTAVITIIGSRQPFSLISSGNARLLSTMSIVEQRAITNPPPEEAKIGKISGSMPMRIMTERTVVGKLGAKVELVRVQAG